MNSIYKILRNRFPLNTVATHHFGKLLICYQDSGHAPPHLLQELEVNEDGKFWSAVWESLLFWHFNSLGFEFVKGRIKKSGQVGPDFGIKYDGKTIWIEAVVPAPQGIPIESLAPPCKIKKPKAQDEPHEQKLLRWTSAIKDKRDKIAGYVNRGVVSANDGFVIAVNSCRLQDFAFDDTGISRFPYALEATFPIGPLAIPLSTEGKVIGPAENTQRYKIQKSNGSMVPTDNFLSTDYRLISAVLGSHQRNLWRKAPLHLSLVHNPLADRPLPTKVFRATKEFVCELAEEGFTLRNI